MCKNVLGVYSFRYVGPNVSEPIISILRKTYNVPSSLIQQESLLIRKAINVADNKALISGGKRNVW